MRVWPRLSGAVAASAIAFVLLALMPAAAFGEATIKASNQSSGTETNTGDATATNSGSGQVGLNGGGSSNVNSADIANRKAVNVQEGDNSLDASQSATAVSGTSIGGQMIGAITDGALTVDATNESDDVDATSGDATATNDFGGFVGLTDATHTAIGADNNIVNNQAKNVQSGDNTSDLMQATDAVTGDAVGGQVFGGRSSGPADIVLSNSSTSATTTTGDSTESSDGTIFTGLNATGVVQT